LAPSLSVCFISIGLDLTVPIEDVTGAVGDLVREGEVRFFGLSEAGVAKVRIQVIGSSVRANPLFDAAQ
jgi:aryl-alcohol dehydrogenase-like predicted oxidoreductase